MAIDDEKAAYDATRHLLKLGHRRIGLLTGDPESVFVAQPRQRGYLKAMAEAKCNPSRPPATSSTKAAPPAWTTCCSRTPASPPIFAMSDEMAAAVVNELQKRGRRVPEDVSVLGFDNTSTALHVHPPLSTMAQPLEEMGRMAVKKLLRSRDLGPRIMPHQLIERGSTAPPPAAPSPPNRPNPTTPNPHPRRQPALPRAAVVVLPCAQNQPPTTQEPH